jgi:ABC-type sulfate transport system permease component
MNKIKQTVTAVRGFFRSLWNGIRKNAAAIAVAGTVAAGALSARAQTTPDPTTIYSSAQTDFNAAVGIAIGAIGIGAAVFFIRKGLKARM